MNAQKNINGIVSSTLEKVAHWFLYIFIDPSAPVSRKILNKRKRQIATLQFIDRINGVYNFQQLVAIIETGIKKKYGLTPVQVLSVVNQASKKRIAGIGSDEVITGSHFDGEIWVNDTTGDPLPQAEQQKATQLANSTVSGTFWSDMANVIDWLVDIFVELGIGKKTTDFTPGTPGFDDWGTDNTSGADISAALPYVAIAVVGYSLWKSTQKK